MTELQTFHMTTEFFLETLFHPALLKVINSQGKEGRKNLLKVLQTIPTNIVIAWDMEPGANHVELGENVAEAIGKACHSHPMANGDKIGGFTYSVVPDMDSRADGGNRIYIIDQKGEELSIKPEAMKHTLSDGL